MFPLQCARPYTNTLCTGPAPIKSQSRDIYFRGSSYGLWFMACLEKISKKKKKIKIDLERVKVEKYSVNDKEILYRMTRYV